jgi:ATP-dependent DNA helicase RecG
MFRTYYQFEEVTGSTRVLREIIPESAFKEAIANALAHRQWDIPAHIRVSMFADKIEIASPGGLPHGLSKEEYLEGQVSVLRNPIIGGVFFRLRLIERFGTGILRIREAYRESERQPQFEVFEGSIRVVLPTVQPKLPISPDAADVLRVITGRRMAISEIVAATGFGKTKTQKLLQSLAADGYARIEGNGRGTRYTA